MTHLPALQAHRGVATECPENTMSAFRAAAAQGYRVIELDPSYTLDCQLAVLHDDTLNRTARLPDGTAPEKPLFLRELTLAQAREFDFGLAFSPKFRGEPLPLLEEALQFAEENGLGVKLDNKIRHFPPEITEKLFALIQKYETTAQPTAADPETLALYAKTFPRAELHYDGPVDASFLARFSYLGRRLTVWLPWNGPHSAWATVPFADEALCEAVKAHAKLGIWLIGDEDSFDTVCRRFSPDIVETNGAVKPRRNKGLICDLHSHTENSHDSTCPIVDLTAAAVQRGISVLAVTDHCDIQYYLSRSIPTRIARSWAQAAEENRQLSGKLRVLQGIEMGESIWFPENTQEILSARPYDVVLGSVHAIRFRDTSEPYSAMDFTDTPQQTVEDYLAGYFDEVYETAQTLSCDILSHLTCPLRYLEGRFSRKIDLTRYEPQITAILALIIRRGIALEVNTSGIGSYYGELMPTLWILEKYRRMGGYLVTLGSDAHTADRLGTGLAEATALLKQLGFRHCFYYENRIAIPYSI